MKLHTFIVVFVSFLLPAEGVFACGRFRARRIARRQSRWCCACHPVAVAPVVIAPAVAAPVVPLVIPAEVAPVAPQPLVVPPPLPQPVGLPQPKELPAPATPAIAPPANAAEPSLPESEPQMRAAMPDGVPSLGGMLGHIERARSALLALATSPPELPTFQVSHQVALRVIRVPVPAGGDVYLDNRPIGNSGEITVPDVGGTIRVEYMHGARVCSKTYRVLPAVADLSPAMVASR